MCQGISRVGEADHAGITWLPYRLSLQYEPRKALQMGQIGDPAEKQPGSWSALGTNVDGDNRLTPITLLCERRHGTSLCGVDISHCGIDRDGRYPSC